MSILRMPPREISMDLPSMSLLAITPHRFHPTFAKADSRSCLLFAIHLADEKSLVAVVAAFDNMTDRKIVPVAFLVWGQSPGAIAEGADASQCSHDCRPDKSRTVRNVFNYLEQIFIYLECNDPLLFFHSLTTLI